MKRYISEKGVRELTKLAHNEFEKKLNADDIKEIDDTDIIDMFDGTPGALPSDNLKVIGDIKAGGKITSDGVEVALAPQVTEVQNNIDNLTTVVNNITTQSLGAVPQTRSINGKSLEDNVTLSIHDILGDGNDSNDNHVAEQLGAVPLERTVNEKPLNENIELTAGDVQAVPITRKVNGKALFADITLSAADVGALPIDGKANTAGSADTAAACTGNAATATKLATARNIQTNLGSTAAASFNGTANVTPGVTGTLPIANGGTGATTAAAARNALGLGNTTGALPIANGGTGQTTAAAARNALGLGNTTGALPVANGGTGATTAATALTNLGAAASSHTHTKSQITDFPTSMTPTAHNHSAANITSGILAAAYGGTGNATGRVQAGQASGATLGTNATSEGSSTTASGSASHAEGFATIAGSAYAHAEGANTAARGSYSHAEGYATIASGYASHADGQGSTALNYASHASGKYNKDMTTGGTAANKTGDVFVIGNGTSTSVLSNAFRVTYAGATYGLSAFNSSGADYAEYFEWLDSNPDNEDRVGYFVTMEGNKIRIADEGDYLLGIVSGQPCIIGNSDEDWLGRWEHDEFGRFIKVDVETPVTELQELTDDEGNPTGEVEEVETGEIIYGWDYKANPNYDPDQSYIERKDRQEWDAIGMLSVRDDGSSQVNGFCRCADGGIATAAEKYIPGQTYRVIARVTENVVKVVFR